MNVQLKRKHCLFIRRTLNMALTELQVLIDLLLVLQCWWEVRDTCTIFHLFIILKKIKIVDS
jgi:hypothetical protein